MDGRPSTDTMQNLQICDNENSVLVKEGFEWARLTGPRKRDRTFCIILTCLGVVTAMAIIAYVKISVDIKELRDSFGNIVGTDKSANESEIEMPAGQSFDYRIAFNSGQKVKTYELENSKVIKQLQDTVKKLNTELQSLKDSQIADNRTLAADSVKNINALLLSELQNAQQNDNQVADNLKLTADSVKILNASLSSQLQNMQQNAVTMQESLSTIRRTVQTLRETDSQIANTQKLNADTIKALEALLLSGVQDVKLNVTRVSDKVQKLDESLSTLGQTLQKYDSQIANTQKLNADSLKALKTLLLSELQAVKPNVKRVSDKLQKLEESLSNLGQTLQKHAVTMQESLSTIRRNVQTLSETDSQIANTQKLNADSIKALKALLLSELQDVKPNVTRVSDEVQKLEESLSTVRQTLQKYDSQIANTQKLNADSLKALKALLLSEFQDVKPNVKRVSDKVQKLEESLSTVRQTLQKYDMHLCPNLWILFAGKCYFFSTSKNKFENARTACQSSQSNLVVINNKMEQDFLATRADSEYYWIGLTDLINEGVWRWEDGTSYSSTPTFWKSNQPDNYQNAEHCAHLAFKGLWNDDYCTTKYRYICERMHI